MSILFFGCLATETLVFSLLLLMSGSLLSLHPALLPDHETPECTNPGEHSLTQVRQDFSSQENTFLCGSWHGSFRTRSCWETSSLGLLFLLPGLLVTARRGTSLQMKYCCPEQWAKHSPQVTHLPAAFGTCTLKSTKQLSSVMMKRYVSYHHEIST